MALSTYTQLLAKLATTLGRADLTSDIPDFVTLAQARINRKVRAQAMETKTTSFSITGEYVNVPSDFRQAIQIYIDAQPRYALKGYDGEGLTDDYKYTGKPTRFQVVGTQFRFAPVPDTTYTATLIYHAKPATLAATTQETNSLFPANADLYYYGSLLEAEAHIGNDPRIPIWKQAFEEALNDLNTESKLVTHGGGSLRTRPA